MTRFAAALAAMIAIVASARAEDVAAEQSIRRRHVHTGIEAHHNVYASRRRDIYDTGFAAICSPLDGMSATATEIPSTADNSADLAALAAAHGP